MNLSLSRKLFACFFLLTAVVLVATLGLARWSFERGFLDYMNILDRYRLDQVARDLIGFYDVGDRSWDNLTQGDFLGVLARHAPPAPPPISPKRARAVDGLAADTGSNIGNRAAGDSGGTDTDDRHGSPPGGSPAGPAAFREPRGRGNSIGPPTALFDENGRWLFGKRLGRDPDQLIRLPVMLNDTAVGELRARVFRHVESASDSAFLRQQTHRSVLIGGVALAMAALVAWGLSRALLKPIHRSLKTVARLSDGNYMAADESLRDRHDELGQLTRDLESLRTTLAANRSSRRRLLADVSHELRTPLTILSGEIEAMRDGLRPMDQDGLASVTEEIERLKRLVNDLYELSVSDAGGLRYEFGPLELAECVEQATTSFEWLAGESGLTINTDLRSRATLAGDRRRLQQLLTNLLANAIAYTDAPGEIAVTLKATATEAVLTIADSAPGVQPAHHDRLFESLYRDDASRSRRTGGAGLGLAICQQIVEAHGGSITAGPSPLGGLSMCVELPLNRRMS